MGKGKLHSMRGDSDGFVLEWKHGDVAWQKSTADERGGGRGGGELPMWFPFQRCQI